MPGRTQGFDSPSIGGVLARAIPAGLVTGVVDGLFSSVLNVAFYHSTVERLWQGVASVLLGPSALKGGTTTEAIGILMHFGVAMSWAIVFSFALAYSPHIRRLLYSPLGPIKAAIVYGPLIWLFMSLIVIPLGVHRPPAITPRWWTQLIGHIPFVAFPIAAVTKAYSRTGRNA